MNQTSHQVSNYVFKDSDFLGEGSFGKVFKGKDITTGREVAVKVLQNDVFVDKYMLESLQKEISVMQELHSENVVRMFGTTQDQSQTYIFIELCHDGDLREYLNKRKGTLPENEAIEVLKQISKGFKDLTDHGYIHRDVKPENTLVDKNTFKLADFGFATKIDIHGSQKLREQVGTPLYMAPQILQNGEYSAKSDIWSLGIMFYEMLFGYTPWPCRDMNSYLENMKAFPQVRFPYGKQIKESTKDLIMKTLELSESKRIGWDEFYEHPCVGVSQGHHIQKQNSLDIKISAASQKILEQVQFMIQTSHINVAQVLNQYPNQIDKVAAYKFLTSVDPRLTNYDVTALFNEMQIGGFVDKQELIKLLTRITFQDNSDIYSRVLTDLREIIKHNNIKLSDIFNNFDSQKSGILAIGDFTKLIRVIAPKLSDNEIQGLFASFDENGNGTIDFQEFQKQLSYALPNQSNNHYNPSKEKAFKILNELRRIIISNNVNMDQIFKNFDKNHDQLLARDEFKNMILVIDSTAHEEDINILFDEFDQSKDGNITIQEFKNEINSK